MLTERGWALSSAAATTGLEPVVQVQVPGRDQLGWPHRNPCPGKGQGWEDAGRGPRWEKLYAGWSHTSIGMQALPLSCQGKGISLNLSLRVVKWAQEQCLPCRMGTRRS